MKKMISLLSVTWFILARFLYSYMSFLYFTWSRNLLKLHSATSRKVITTKLGGNTYKNEILTYLHMMWPNHAKRIKATALKLALWWKVSISAGHVIFDYIISWEMKRAYGTFTKAVRHQIWYKNPENYILIL